MFCSFFLAILVLIEFLTSLLFLKHRIPSIYLFNFKHSEIPSNNNSTLLSNIHDNLTSRSNDFDSVLFIEMISSINHRLHYSTCESANFYQTVMTPRGDQAKYANERNTVRLEAEKLFVYLNRTLGKIPEVITKNITIVDAHDEPVASTQRAHSTSFPSLLDFWKFMFKIFLLTIIIIILTYLIIRALLWLIEYAFKPNGDNSRGTPIYLVTKIHETFR